MGASKRVKWMVVMLVMLGMIAAACGGEGNGSGGSGGNGVAVDGGSKTDVQPNKPVKLTYWHIWGADREPILRSILDEFTALHPHITVEAVLQPNQEYGTKAMTALLGKSAPDVMMIFTDVYTRAARSGSLLQLDDFLAGSNIAKEEYLNGALGIATIDGKLFGLPYVLQGGDGFFAINNKLFRENGLDPQNPPQTWAEYAEASKAINKVEDGSIRILGGGNLDFLTGIYNNGGNVVSDDGQKATFNSPQGLETLTFLQELTEISGGADALSRFNETAKSAPGGYAFYTDTVGMYGLGPFIVNQMKTLAPDVDYSIMPTPYGPGATGSTSPVRGGWMNAIPKNGENQEAAWELVKYLTHGEGMKKFMAAQTRFSTVKVYNSGAELDKIREGNPYADQILAIMESSVGLPLVAATTEFNAVLLEMTEKVIYKQMTPEEALKEAEEKANAVIKAYNDNAR